MIEEVDKCDGEARANNRKGKLIFFYEWEITLKWKGDCFHYNRILSLVFFKDMSMEVIRR